MDKNQDKSADPASQDNKDDNLDKNQSTKEDATTDSSRKESKGDDPKDYGRKMKARAERAEKEAQEAKAKATELEEALAAKADSKGEVSDEDLEKLAEKHDVSLEFVKDLGSIFSGKASKAAEKLVSDKLSEKDQEIAKRQILNDFKRDFDKLDADWEGAALSEGAVRNNYLTEKAKNPDHTVADSIEEIYGSFRSGKATVEDDPRGADPVGDSIDFDALSNDPEKLNKVLKDPKASEKYLAWRDKKGI